MDNSNSNKKDKVNSLFALDIVKASEEHTKLQTFVLFKQAINDDIKCPQNQINLKKLCALYGLAFLMKDCKNCYECGYFAQNTIDQINEAMKALNRDIREFALNLVESFNVSDMSL